MDPKARKRSKKLILNDYKQSGKELGDFALEWMNDYTEVCYEVKLTNATSKGKKVQGTAVLGSMEAVQDFIYIYQIDGDYSITMVDTQKEFFTILEEIKKDLKS